MDKKQLRDQFQNRARDDPERVFEDLDKDAARLRKPSSSGSRYGTATGAAVCALEAGGAGVFSSAHPASKNADKVQRTSAIWRIMASLPF